MLVALPASHLKTTWSPLSGVLSLSWSRERSATAGFLQSPGSRGMATHPPCGRHSSHVGQTTGVEPPQTPAVHDSPVVQAVWSEHGPPSGTSSQFVEQQSSSTALPSSHDSWNTPGPVSSVPSPQRDSMNGRWLGPGVAVSEVSMDWQQISLLAVPRNAAERPELLAIDDPAYFRVHA